MSKVAKLSSIVEHCQSRIGRLKYACYVLLDLWALIMLLGFMMPLVYGVEKLAMDTGISQTILAPILAALFLVCIIGLILLSIKRLHDLDMSGWWILFFCIPNAYTMLGAFLFLVCIPSTPDVNRFGALPSSDMTFIKTLGGVLIILILLSTLGM